MTSEEIAMVKQKADLINCISMDYHLSHAVFACNKITEAEFKDNYLKNKKDEYKERLQAAENAGNIEEIARINKVIEQLKAPYRIYIEYIKRGKARAIFLVPSNQFVITLPEGLLAQSRDANGAYNETGVKELRRTTAHELGHIALHIKDLLKNPSTQGTLDMKGKQEEEANLFSDELLALRYKRNKELFNTGKWKAF